MTRFRSLFVLVLLAVMAVIARPGAGQAGGGPASKVPDQLAGVGITEHLERSVPENLPFVDEQGRAVTLARYLHRDRPVILTLNYYECPMLCTLQLNGLADGMSGLSWGAGQEYEVVTVSINPLETPQLARAKKASYLERLRRPAAGRGWHFLTGDERSIEALTDAVGFRYRFDPKTGQFAHVAALAILTPEGRIARYLYGIEYPPKTLKLALLEASEGKTGSTWDRIILYCCRYDPQNRRYTPVAMNIMRLGGAATLLVLGVVLVPFWIRSRRRHGGGGGEAAG